MVVWFRPGCDVTSTPVIAKSGWEKIFLRSDLSSTHHWLSNAPSLVSVRATELSMSQNSLLWCIRTSHIAPVTSLPFRLSGDPHAKNFFWGQIWNVLISSFRTRHRSSLYEEYPSGSHKTLFAWGPPFPMSPVPTWYNLFGGRLPMNNNSKKQI